MITLENVPSVAIASAINRKKKPTLINRWVLETKDIKQPITDCPVWLCLSIFGHGLAHTLYVSQDHGQTAFEYLRWGGPCYFYYYWYFIYIYAHICMHTWQVLLRPSKSCFRHLNIPFGSFPPFLFFFSLWHHIWNSKLTENAQSDCMRISTSCFKPLSTKMQDSKNSIG